jgi:hypothetical protein
MLATMGLPRSPRRVFLLAGLAFFIMFTLTARFSAYDGLFHYNIIPCSNLGFSTVSSSSHPPNSTSPGRAHLGLGLPDDEDRSPSAAEWSRISLSSSKESDTVSSKVTNVTEYLQQILRWPRPTYKGHWPPYADYVDKDYDPNRWEQFPMDEGFYNGNGIDAAHMQESLSTWSQV